MLDLAECLALMSRVPVGRLVFTAGGLPAVHPVPFVLEARTITFCVDDDRVRAAAERGDVVAFQVDELDAERFGGWTVTAIGHASLVTGPTEDYVRIPVEATDGRLLAPVRRMAGVWRQVPS